MVFCNKNSAYTFVIVALPIKKKKKRLNFTAIVSPCMFGAIPIYIYIYIPDGDLNGNARREAQGRSKQKKNIIQQ